MKLRANLGNRSKGGDVAPDGDYIAEVLRVEEGLSKVKKSEQLFVELEVAEGPFKGSSIKDYIPLASNCEFRVSNFLYACGFEGDSDIEVETSDIARYDGDRQVNNEGAFVKIRKTSEKVGEKTYARVSYFRPESPKPVESAAPAAQRTAVRTVIQR